MTALADIVDHEAGVAYPGRLLINGETALVLFAAGFMGKQDAYWIADAGLTATCVDASARLIHDMAAMYPADWLFCVEDAYEMAANAARAAEQWDIVSLDPWTQDFQRCADNLETWCSLARRSVILGTGHDTRVSPPMGWAVTEVRKRSDYLGGVYWTCVEPT